MLGKSKMAKTSITIIDSHAHCGVLDQSWPQSFEDYEQKVAETDIFGVAFFSPVYEIYDRYDYNFVDTFSWQQRRAKSNAYLLSVKPAVLHEPESRG